MLGQCTNACCGSEINCKFYVVLSHLFVGIRTSLLESDDHTCPTCHQTDVSPDALIANKFLRQVSSGLALIKPFLVVSVRVCLLPLFELPFGLSWVDIIGKLWREECGLTRLAVPRFSFPLPLVTSKG